MADIKRQRKKQAIKAKLLATLVYYDEPQVLLLSSSADVRYVAVAVPDEQVDQLFFASKINMTEWIRYNTGYTDLRYLFTGVPKKKWFTFDLLQMSDGIVALSPIDESAVPADFLPSHGFFSRNHTTAYEASEAIDTLRTIDIDGSWKLNDFSKLYARTEDIYAFFTALKYYKLSDLRADTKRMIKAAFLSYPWRGGGSYVNFFDDLFCVLTENDRVGVKAIKYASPGQIKLKGSPDMLDAVRDCAGNFLDNKLKIEKEYSKLYKYLKESKLLKTDSEKFDKDSPTADHILKLAKSLATEMSIEDFQLIHTLAGKNSLATAKIILAVERRVRDLDNFVSEGRLEFW